jgi:hypothetical protein
MSIFGVLNRQWSVGIDKTAPNSRILKIHTNDIWSLNAHQGVGPTIFAMVMQGKDSTALNSWR